MTKEELEKENANLKALRKYELNVAKLEIEKLEQRNAELEEEKCELLGIIQGKDKVIQELKKENAELRNIAEFQQSSNMNRYFENKKLKDENTELKEKLNIRSCQNCKHNNKSCPNDGSCVRYSKCEDYKNPKLTKAKEILEDIIKFQPYIDRDAMFLTIGNDWKEVIFKAEQFIKE